MIKTKTDPIPPEELRKLLRYDPESGKLWWLPRGNPWWDARWAGTEALNCPLQSGYLHGRIYGQAYRAHRVIVAMVTGEWPEQVEHDNRNRADNRWVNIAPTNSKEQAKNKKLRKDNSSGVVGVQKDFRTGKWFATIAGKHLRGGFTDINDAIAIRAAAERELGYHPNHGREVQ